MNETEAKEIITNSLMLQFGDNTDLVKRVIIDQWRHHLPLWTCMELIDLEEINNTFSKESSIEIHSATSLKHIVFSCEDGRKIFNNHQELLVETILDVCNTVEALEEL